MQRRVLRLTTDEEAAALLAQDLSDLDFSQFKPARFAFEKKSERITMRVPKPLLDALKKRASHRGIPYTRLIREIIERVIALAGRLKGRSGILRRDAESLRMVSLSRSP